MHRDFRKPLIIMTPKSLLRNKYCVSNLEDFSKENSFHRILWDHAVDQKNDSFIKLRKTSEIKKVIMCSGKVYFDLLDAREKLKIDDVILFRIEQLYPFPAGNGYSCSILNNITSSIFSFSLASNKSK